MARLKGLFYIILFNILVSATTTLGVLILWEQARLGEKLVPGGQVPSPIVIYVPITGTPPADLSLLAAAQQIAESRAMTDTATPTLEDISLEVYQVRPGDSLGVIAQRFDISVADILAFNPLQDPNTVLVGQELLIPSRSLPTETPIIPTATQTATPTPTARQSPTPSLTATRTPNQDEPDVRIEVVLAPGDFGSERVRLVHGGGRQVSLEGWRLEDEDGNRYVFPQLLLLQGSSINVHTRGGVDTVSDLFWGKTTAVWRSGEEVVLRDKDGNEQDRFTIP
jgi:LysM repeat protein